MLTVTPTLYAGYTVSVQRMVMENRPYTTRVASGGVTDLHRS